VGRGALALLGPETGEAGRGAQLKRLRTLLVRYLYCPMEAALSLGAVRRRLSEQQLAFEPVEVGFPPTLAALVGEVQGLGNGALPRLSAPGPSTDLGQKR
jgi:hypothetical protein